MIDKNSVEYREHEDALTREGKSTAMKYAAFMDGKPLHVSELNFLLFALLETMRGSRYNSAVSTQLYQIEKRLTQLADNSSVSVYGLKYDPNAPEPDGDD